MRRRRALILAIVLLGGCAHGAAHRPGEEYLGGIDFEGNRRLSDRTLLDGLALHRVLERGGALDPYLVQSDADRIRGEYLRRGYLDADVRSRVERSGDAARVIYTIEEGPRATTRVEITGLPDDVPVAEVRAQLPLEDGQPFSYEPYDRAKPLVLAAVQDAGYARAKLDASVIADRADRTAIVELAFTPGPKCRFGAVQITGVTGELATAVRERLAFSPGQVYSTRAITQTQRNLYALGRFSTVQVQPDRRGDQAVVGVHIAVAESARHEVSLGGGFGIDPTGYEVRGRAGYAIAGWPYPLDTVTLDLRPAYAYVKDVGFEPRVRALAKLERQDLFWTYAKGEIAAGYNYLAVEAFTSTGPLARVGLETPIATDRLRLRVGWRFQQAWFPASQINPVLTLPQYDQLRHDLGIEHSERLGACEQALVADLRDHPLEPTLGAYGELHTAEGTAFAGSAYHYFELIGDARGYVPLALGAVLAGRARYGAIYGDIPPTERLFSGGAVSQRGFGERRLAPSVTGPMNGPKGGSTVTVPYGGGGLFETSIEARVPVVTIRSIPVEVAAFLDGGDVRETPGELDLGHLNWAAGGGLRLRTVVGPVRFDVGYRLNRTGPTDPDPGSYYAYHLTIGEAF